MDEPYFFQSAKLVIFDFDGTLVEATAESHQALQHAFIERVAASLDLKPTKLAELFIEQSAQVRANPGDYGLSSLDNRLACGVCDQLILLTASAYALTGVRPTDFSTAKWHQLIQDNFYAAYGQLTFTLKPDARVLIPLLAREKTHIVTNSPGAVVSERLRSFTKNQPDLDWLAEYVSGTAKKFIIGEMPDTIPETITLPGLKRPVYPRRSLYWNVVNTLREARQAAWPEVTVIGDIAELDLITFALLGARVVLVRGTLTPAYELAYIESLPPGQGCVITKLTELI